MAEWQCQVMFSLNYQSATLLPWVAIWQSLEILALRLHQHYYGISSLQFLL